MYHVCFWVIIIPPTFVLLSSLLCGGPKKFGARGKSIISTIGRTGPEKGDISTRIQTPVVKSVFMAKFIMSMSTVKSRHSLSSLMLFLCYSFIMALLVSVELSYENWQYYLKLSYRLTHFCIKPYLSITAKTILGTVLPGCFYVCMWVLKIVATPFNLQNLKNFGIIFFMWLSGFSFF